MEMEAKSSSPSPGGGRNDGCWSPQDLVATYSSKSKPKLPDPKYHPQWKLRRVMSGHTGWVRSLAVDISNKWFASGSADRTIKIWDLASGTLKVTLTGHIGSVRGLAISERHPYLFSCGDDKMVKCWDLEQNRVVRHYHGHLSGVQAIQLHPTLDIVVTAGRDGTPRVWDMRTKQPIHTLVGHRDAVPALLVNEATPHIVSGSMDSTIRLWDLAAGKTLVELTHHKKGVRALAAHPIEFTMASASADKLKKWGLPAGQFLHNFEYSHHPLHNHLHNHDRPSIAPSESKSLATGGVLGTTTIVNSMAINADGVLASAGDDGTLRFWDWPSGQLFQTAKTIPQPGSLDSEAGIFACTFDRTGLRLFTAEVDKTIKVWAEVDEE